MKKKTLRGLFCLRIKWTTELERKVKGRKRERNKVRNRFSKFEIGLMRMRQNNRQSSSSQALWNHFVTFFFLFVCLFVFFRVFDVPRIH